MAVGASVGWVSLSYLWEAGYLHPYRNYVASYLVIVGPMLLPAILGVRKRPELRLRLITFPTLLSSFSFLLLAPCPSMTPKGLGSLYLNFVYPRIVAPAVIVGAAAAIVYVKLFRGNGMNIGC